jgi:hypothetical protein
MKYAGGVFLVLYAAMQTFGWGRFPDDERGKLPPNVRSAPGGLLLWHSGFMGGK